MQAQHIGDVLDRHALPRWRLDVAGVDEDTPKPNSRKIGPADGEPSLKRRAAGRC